MLINPAAAAPNAKAAAPAAAAAALTQAEANWEYPNGNQFAQNYNPQTQINSANAQNLGLNWIYPLPEKPLALNGFGPGGVGVGMPVIIVNGTAFATTVFDETIAFNVANGNVLWTYTYPLSLNATLSGSAPLSLHSHDGNEWFTTATFGSGVSGPTLWLQGQNFVVYAINALSGKPELNFTDFTGLSMVAGNSPTSLYHDVGASDIVIDQQRAILISGHDAEGASNNGRGFFAGWNINANPPTLAWISYTTPPQAGGNLPVDPNWAIKDIANMSHAYTFDPGKNAANGYTTPQEVQGGPLTNTNDNIVVNWKTLSQSQLNATLYNDWGQADQSAQCQAVTAGESTGSTGSGWGGAWLIGSGPTSGMAFVATNNKDPYVGPCTPGPDLWAAAILALNVTNGHWIWGFQTNPHDIWDWDCSWWQALGNETINGVNTPVIFKTCKNGYLYQVNALTGDLIWSWNPPSSTIPRCSVCYMWNALNSTQMNFDFPTALLTFKSGQPITGPQPDYLEYPGLVAGFEDVNAFNPATNTVIAAAHNVPNTVSYLGLNSSTYFTSSGEVFGPFGPGGLRLTEASAANATVFGINGATGATKWDYFIPNQGYRGGLSISGNMVFLTLTSGDLLMLDQTNGQVVRDYYIGAPMDEPASVGASVSGQEFIILPVGTCSLVAVVTCPGTTPGDILALSLQAGGVIGTTTTVTASGSVSTTTTTVTASGSVSTTTTTAPGTATTTSGFSATTVYGLAAVTVIFIIATGYLAMRGRKPAS